MAKSKTTLKKGENLPPRGKAFKTKVLDVIKAESLLTLPKDATRDATERAFIKHWATRAFTVDSPESSMLLRELISKMFPSLKPTTESYSFDMAEKGTDADKASCVLAAVSKGEIPADIGQMIVGIIKDGSVIEANTELKERIESIEKQLGLIDGE